ncbi:hypothetical protein PCANC_19908 [Puccinia coronata f. sp. avenae]|uniref:Uncharacterized protein n=1 Tax=Puccinia coronata f. sp. avenae TaxID=200324 RepID=A0A2N5S5F4_9BASI|nr:hypothetical protein PCANC_19908 [Puccinia coronata f. sp. avenae]
MAEPYTLLMSDVGHQECVTIPTAIGNQEGETCEPCSYRCLGTTSCLGIGCRGVCVRDFSRGQIRDLPVQTDGRTDIVASIPFPSNKGFRRQKNIDKGQSQVHPRQFMMRNNYASHRSTFHTTPSAHNPTEVFGQIANCPFNKQYLVQMLCLPKIIAALLVLVSFLGSARSAEDLTGTAEDLTADLNFINAVEKSCNCVLPPDTTHKRDVTNEVTFCGAERMRGPLGETCKRRMSQTNPLSQKLPQHTIKEL